MRFDTIHPVSVPIRYWYDNRPFFTHSYAECGGLCCSWYYGKPAIVYNHWYICNTRAHISLSLCGAPSLCRYADA